MVFPVVMYGGESWTIKKAECQLMLRLKLQCFGCLMQRANSLEKILVLGKIEGKRKRGQQRMRWFDGISDSMDRTLSKLQEMVKDGEVWRGVDHEVPKSQTRLSY